MAPAPVRTRFAPSPSGALHLGNARTALFNWLHARAAGGAFVLRVEDTDVDRSEAVHLEALQADLRWLGLAWDEGPDIGGPHAPYRQSERLAAHREHLERLLAADRAYPCFCTAAELEAARARQRAAGKPPRYPGTCARLDEAARAARRAEGRRPALRFRVPARERVDFDDLVRGRQTWRPAELGDFVVARADGTPAFLFANAVDDALMAISHVLRGEDHLANTPRQLLLLEALGLPAPAYGHLALVLGDDGRPLSKRDGAAAVADLRAAGYRPEALVNHLARLGYTPPDDGLLSLPALARGFAPARAGRAGARHDRGALDAWQGAALEALDDAALWAWIAAHAPADAPALPVDGPAFAAAVRANVHLPADAWYWARALFDPAAEPEPGARTAIAEAGPAFFRAALAVGEPDPAADFAGWARALGAATGTRGRSLFRPLRAALTGALAGPELAAVVPLIPADLLRARLRARGAD